jgi:hypothetical protein
MKNDERWELFNGLWQPSRKTISRKNRSSSKARRWLKLDLNSLATITLAGLTAWLAWDTHRLANFTAEESRIERIPIVYVECTGIIRTPNTKLQGTMTGPTFDFSEVWKTFPHMKSINGQAIAMYPSPNVDECHVHNYGKLPVIGLSLPIIAHLYEGPVVSQKCENPPTCSFDWRKATPIEARMLFPTNMGAGTPFTIEPGGVRSFYMANLYRQNLEYEFAPSAEVKIPPDGQLTSVPIIEGSFMSSHMLPPGSDCPPPGWPSTPIMVKGVIVKC